MHEVCCMHYNTGKVICLIREIRKWGHYLGIVTNNPKATYTYVVLRTYWLKWSANWSTSRKDIKEEVKPCTSIFCRSQIGTCYHMIALWLILGKNVWTDNAGSHGCKKQHHLRTRGKDEILGRNNITWSLYDSLLIMKRLPRR